MVLAASLHRIEMLASCPLQESFLMLHHLCLSWCLQHCWRHHQLHPHPDQQHQLHPHPETVGQVLGTWVGAAGVSA